MANYRELSRSFVSDQIPLQSDPDTDTDTEINNQLQTLADLQLWPQLTESQDQ